MKVCPVHRELGLHILTINQDNGPRAYSQDNPMGDIFSIKNPFSKITIVSVTLINPNHHNVYSTQEFHLIVFLLSESIEQKSFL